MPRHENMARRWTFDWPLAVDMARSGATVEFIAQRLGRSVAQVIWKFNNEGRPLPPRDGSRKRGPRNRSEPEGDSERLVPAKISAAQDAERNARAAAAARRSLTAQIFGDPPPGFSALDRKQAERRP
jgi:hypothetical protein